MNRKRRTETTRHHTEILTCVMEKTPPRYRGHPGKLLSAIGESANATMLLSAMHSMQIR